MSFLLVRALYDGAELRERQKGKTEMEFGQRRLIAAHDMTDDMGCTDL